MEQVPFVSVVIPTRNRAALLTKCLESLFEQEYPADRWEIVVVEDGSSEGGAAVESCRSKSPVPLAYARIPRSGSAKARNVGVERSHGEIIAFIDDDAVAVPEWLEAIARRMTQEKIGGVGGRVSSDYPEDKFQAELTARGDLLWTGINCQIETPQDASFLPGGNFAFRRRALEEAGGFDPDYSKRGVWREDTDICVAVRNKGHRLVFDSRVKVLHLGARWLHPLERVKPIVVWFMARDDAYFRAKNFGWAGVHGAAASQARQAGTRLALAAVNFVLVFVHLLAWIPGVLHGLRRQPAKVQTANS